MPVKPLGTHGINHQPVRAVCGVAVQVPAINSAGICWLAGAYWHCRGAMKQEEHVPYGHPFTVYIYIYGAAARGVVTVLFCFFLPIRIVFVSSPHSRYIQINAQLLDYEFQRNPRSHS